VALLISVFIDWKPAVPLIVAVADGYPAPLGPVPLADIDRTALEVLGTKRAYLGRGTARPFDVLRGLDVVDKEQLRNAIVRGVAGTRGGGPGRSTAIVFVAAVGGVDRDGHACLVPPRLPLVAPADADRSWLRVGELLDDLVALDKKPKHVIVILDGCRRCPGEALGILDGGFAAAVAADVLAEKRPGISVIVPAAPGEVACAAPSDSQSVFTRAFIDGIEGCADADGNGRVSLRELGGYLKDEVGSRALLLYGRRQSPFVAPQPTAADADVGVSWAVRRSPLVAEAADMPSDADEWIDRQWDELERLRPRGIAERPEAWACLERLMLRAERLAAVGPEARSRPLRAVREDIETLVQRLSEPLFQAETVPSVRLAEVLGLHRGVVDAEWRAAVETWRSGRPPAADGPAAACKDLDEWHGRLREAWQAAVQRIENGATVDRESWKAWEQLLGQRPETTPGRTPWPQEIQTARLLLRWGERNAWQRDPATCGRVITVVDAALKAAVPDDVRADSMMTQLFPRRGADRMRREAFDLVAVGDETSLARAANLVEQASTQYAAISVDANAISSAWKLLDQLRAELPWLAIWHRRLAISGEEPKKPASGAEPDWQPIIDAAERLEKSLTQPTSRGVDVLASIRTAFDDAERPFRAVRAAYEDACGRLADPSADNATTLAEVRGVLSVPLVVGRQRARLKRRERELVAAIAAEQRRDRTGRQPRVPAPTENAAGLASVSWVRGKGGLIDPLVATLVPDAAAVREPQSPADVASAHAAWGQKLRDSLGASSGTQGSVRETAGEGRQPVTTDDQEAAISRRLAILRTGLPDQSIATVVGNTPSTDLLRRRWQVRLLAAASDAVDEFLAGSDRDDAHWFIEAARCSLVSANHIDASGSTAPLAEKVLARVESLARVGERWASLESDPDRLGGGDGTGSSPVTSMLKITGDVADLVPTGDAALWLSPGSPDEALWLGVAGDSPEGSAAARRMALPVAKPDAAGSPRNCRWRVAAESAAQLRPEDRGSLDATAWFRGHQIQSPMRLVADGGGVPVVWRRRDAKPPRITVAGRDRKHGYVSFIYDCSGSMTPARMDKGRRAMATALESLAQTGSWDASLWLYGHRAGWTQSPPYKVEYSDLGKRQKRATLPQPEDDVELMQRMAFVSPTLVQQLRPMLDAVRGWGETPLYLAMRSALSTDSVLVPNGDFWKVIVITDGVNRLARAEKPTTARDVLDELVGVNRTRSVPVTIDVIALDLQPRDAQERTSYDELRSLVRDVKGQWRDAADLEQLKQAFRDFLGLVRWEAVGSTGTPRQAEIGHALEVTPGSYAVRIDGQPATESRVVVEGGEIVELFTAATDRPLEHRRYDGGTEQGIRSSQRGLEDPRTDRVPGDFPARWFVAAHLPRREGGSRVRFPISLQNDDAGRFSPRPAVLWAEVRPRGVAGARPFVFFDADLEPERPVPVVDLTVESWPKDADEAEVLVWFSPRPIDAAARIRLDELDFGEARPFRFSDSVPGVTFDTTLKKVDDSHGRFTVLERHADQRDLPRLRLWLEPSCDRAEHVVDEAAGTVRHVFDFPLDRGRVPADARLCVAGRDDVKEQCVKPASDGGRTEPLRVRLPPRE